MIRTYLRFIETIEMISRRLTKTQKVEILEAYSSGDNTNYLAEKYNCTSNTINRTVKNFLTESEYALLKKNRLKINKKTIKGKKKDIEKENSLNKLTEKVKEEHFSVTVNEKSDTAEFAEIAPLELFGSDEIVVDLNFENTQNKNQDIVENNKSF